MTVAMPRSPFLDVQSFLTAEEAPSSTPAQSDLPSRSPFLSLYELDGQAWEVVDDNPVREAYATLINELYDEEFDVALYELGSYLRGLHDEQLSMGAPREEADRLVTQHFTQLSSASDETIDAMGREFGWRDETGIMDQEIDSFLDAYTTSPELDPQFEQFFGALKKKFKKFAKAAVGAVGKVVKSVANIALGPLLSRLKGVVKSLLKRVLQRAIGRLPAPLQPVAQKLAQKLGFSKPKPAVPSMAISAPPPPPPPAAPPDLSAADAAASVPSEPSTPSAPSDPSADGAAIAPDAADAGVQEPVGADSPTPQEEFNDLIACAFLARDQDEFNLETGQVLASYTDRAVPVFAELDDAREQFIDELNGLKEGESAEPAIQRFLPLAMAPLKLGLKILGRQKLINFLAKLLAKLVAKLVGPQAAPALSRSIVGAGLTLFGLEIPEAERSDLAGSAVAATVEETLNRIAALPAYVLDNQELLEGFALEAFEQAAASTLPAVLSENTYRQRPELLEAGLDAGWVLLPLYGRKRYKKCTRPFQVRVSPYMALEVDSFEAEPLAEYLEDQLGLPEGAEVEAEVSLYEALPGTTLGDIARGERETLGSALSDQANAMQLHPLTPETASTLLNKPGLGRTSLYDPTRLKVGERFYSLSIPGRRPLSVPGEGYRPQSRRRLRLNITLNSVLDQVSICLFLSEVKAQKLAVRLRQSTHGGGIAVPFQRALGRRLQYIFSGGPPGCLRIVHAGMRPGHSPRRALQALPRPIASAFAAKTQEWLLSGFTAFLGTQAQQLLAATEDPADGVTFRFTIEHPPGLREFSQALVDRGPAGSAVAQALASGPRPLVRVEVVAGYRCA